VEQQPVVEEEKDVQDHMTEVIIKKLLKNEDVTSFLQDHHLFMEVVADEINEAYYDEIGDNIVEIEDNKLVFIEDYREDIEELLYGRK
ncbi:tellurite resistance TerB C-terminal domain-containing protein, partial [Sharpea azabuensis]